MSHHLKILTQAGLIEGRREGNSIFYRRARLRADDPGFALKSALFNTLDQSVMDAPAAAQLDEIVKERRLASLQFFQDNAEKFRTQQELIAEHSVYAPVVAELVRASLRRRRALEVGPGDGEFLEILAAEFTQVLALDNSKDMLQKARARCEQQGLKHVSLRCDDTSYLQGLDADIDCAVINMVLHHVPTPITVVQDVAGALTPGGNLVICDLCAHDQSWAQTACGDLWLGFDSEEILQWAQDAGLKLQQSSYLALRNGFQIQVHQFFKP